MSSHSTQSVRTAPHRQQHLAQQSITGHDLAKAQLATVFMDCMIHALDTETLQLELIQDTRLVQPLPEESAPERLRGIELVTFGAAVLQSWFSSDGTCGSR